MIGDSGGSIQDISENMNFTAQSSVTTKSKRHDAQRLRKTLLKRDD